MHSSWYSRSCIFGGATTVGGGVGGAAAGNLRALDAYRTGVRTDTWPVCLQYLNAWRDTRNMKVLQGKERTCREVTIFDALDDAGRGISRVQKSPTKKCLSRLQLQCSCIT